ncbi:DUF6020 family protein [Oenococcus alcoholitolerans]|uniref:DUF6020 family protein n=1 Tax=Oenococcus alcoholitolerans TaxID=931074 RepID=UPI003F6F02BE
MKKKILNNIKKIFKNPIFVGLISSFAFFINFKKVNDFNFFNVVHTRFVYPNICLVLISFLLPIIIQEELLKKQNKELNKNIVDKKILIVTSSIFSFFTLLGESISNTNSLELLFASKTTFFISFLFFVSFDIFIYYLISLFFLIRNRLLSSNIFEKKFYTPNFFITVLIILLFWSPIIIFILPSTIGYDGARQINEFFRVSIPQLDFRYFPTNHHPWFSTLIMGGIFKTGLFLFKTNTGAFYFHSIVLIIFSSVSYSFLINSVKKIINNSWLTWLLIIFFGLEPRFASYSVTFDKTGWFLASSALFLGFLISLFLAIDKPKSLLFVVGLILSSIFVCFFRNNGLYVVLPTLFVAIFVFKDNFRKLLILLSMVLVFLTYHSWNQFLKNQNVMPSSPAEMLVVPIQQISYLEFNFPNEISKTEQKNIEKVFDLKKVDSTFNPVFADPSKNLFRYDSFLINGDSILRYKHIGKWWDSDIYKRNTRIFLSTWFQLFLKHPLQFFTATLKNQSLSIDPLPERELDPNNTYGSLSIYSGIPKNNYFVLSSKYLNNVKPLIDQGNKNYLSNYLVVLTSLPFFAFVFNVALWNLVLIGSFIFSISKKNYYQSLFLIPSIMTFLVNLNGSVNGDPRYALPIEIMAFPIMLISFRSKKSIFSKI